MSQYRIAAAARADLEEIWLFIARDNTDAADRFVHLLVSRCPLLASTPLLGHKREELAPGVRSLAVGTYVIF